MKTSIIVSLDKSKQPKLQPEDKFHYNPFNETEASLIYDETSQEVDTEVDNEF